MEILSLLFTATSRLLVESVYTRLLRRLFGSHILAFVAGSAHPDPVVTFVASLARGASGWAFVTVSVLSATVAAQIRLLSLAFVMLCVVAHDLPVAGSSAEAINIFIIAANVLKLPGSCLK